MWLHIYYIWFKSFYLLLFWTAIPIEGNAGYKRYPVIWASQIHVEFIQSVEQTSPVIPLKYNFCVIVARRGDLNITARTRRRLA